MKITKSVVMAMTILATAGLGGVAHADTDTCGKSMTLAEKVQQTLDVQEIRNVADMHEYYHNALMHQAELDNIWAHSRSDVTWTNNTDKYIGWKSLDKFYVDGLKQMTAAGALWYHMLTTPVIVVAGDGKTAKGIFMSFGNVSGKMGPNGKPAAQWTEEKYGIDFIKENGHWKIWHLRTYVEFYSSTDGTWLNPKDNIASGVGTPPMPTPKDTKLSAGVKAEPGVSFKMAQPDEKGNFYQGYTPDRIPAYAPEIPKAYCTFSQVKPF